MNLMVYFLSITENLNEPINGIGIGIIFTCIFSIIIALIVILFIEKNILKDFVKYIKYFVLLIFIGIGMQLVAAFMPTQK